MIPGGGLATIFLIICGFGQLCAAHLEGIGIASLTTGHFGSALFRFFNNPHLDWVSAERYCNQFGTVHDGGEDQLAHLYQSIRNLKTPLLSLWESLREPSTDRKECWMGYNEIAEEGSWVWTDQSPSKYEKWGSGQPNNSSGDQDCGALDTIGTGRYFGAWDDGTCSVRRPFICKVVPVFINH
ncbi:putative ladderlectin-like isoform X4 [Apostichopus japonicus]|uniref:Putative ladderlectin-like isoform X4 n=1 Tax=Stichopus japonicus TaxID=307972 RepID=A0A2G8L0X4_STIJA|nr:putative ladderlectin-like isoform X4 [Apostichopus japonicus]